MGDLPSRLDFFRLGRDYVTSRNTKLDPAQADIEGSDLNIFLGVTSVIADKVTRQLAYRTAALLLDGATEEDLDRLVFDRFQIFRKGASGAVGSIKIFRTSFAAGAGSVPTGTVVTSNTGIEYVTLTTATFGATDVVSRADVRASQAGKDTQVGAGAITNFASAGDLFDPTLQVVNELPTAGGEDVETDQFLRDRARTFWTSAQRGTLSAIEFGAKTVSGVVSAQAIEAVDDGPTPARIVNLYISDSSGVASEVLAQQVRVALQDYRAAGIQVIVFTSLPELVDIQLRLRFRANVDTVTLTEIVRNGVVAFVNSLPVNGTLYVSQLYATLQRYVDDGLIVDKDTLVAPVGDLVPTIGQTIRATLTTVTAVT